MAWLRLRSLIWKPRRLNSETTLSYAAWQNTSSVSKNLQTVGFVMSSAVGPNPPVTKTRSASMQALKASRIALSESPMVKVESSWKPALERCSPSHAALVLITCPISSSSPIEIFFMTISFIIFQICAKIGHFSSQSHKITGISDNFVSLRSQIQ